MYNNEPFPSKKFQQVMIDYRDNNNMKHEDLVKALVKPAKQIQSEIGAKCLGLIHMVMGISGETGELLDAVKKHVMYRKPLDIENVIEELGDIEFYLEGFRQELSITREECLLANIKKLQQRYSDGQYSNEHAINRADKLERKDNRILEEEQTHSSERENIDETMPEVRQ